jgi:predicted Zn-dependent protease
MAVVATLVLAAVTQSAAALELPPAQTPGPASAFELDEATRRLAEVERAVKAFAKGEFNAGLKQLEEAVKAQPTLAPAQLLFAKLAFHSNQMALVRPALERAAAQAPDHPEVYLLFGNLALLEGRLTDAAVHFDKANALITSSPKSLPADLRRHFVLLCHQGTALVAEGRSDWTSAQKSLADWLALEPANGGVRQRLGKALFHLGNYAEAQQELERASQDDPALEPAAVSMAWLCTRAGDLKKGEDWLKYAVKTAPNSAAVRMGIASWLLEQGRADEATEQASAAAKIDPRSASVKRLIALAARQRKDLGAAEQALQDLAAASPGDAWVRSQLALVLAEQPDDAKHRRALELAELGVRQNPGAAESLATLGTVYYRQHRLDEAEKVLQAVVASGKGNSDVAYVLAQVEADRGNRDAATALLKTALAAPGLFVFRKDAQQRLDRLTAAANSKQ